VFRGFDKAIKRTNVCVGLLEALVVVIVDHSARATATTRARTAALLALIDTRTRGRLEALGRWLKADLNV
jgi:hypothetical protein